MTNEQTTMTIRGLARYAARKGTPLGAAYREACRAHTFVCGSFATFADAYDDERAAISEVA